MLIPFHAFLTVWLSQLVGHYTVLRLWKEALLIPLTTGAIILLLRRPNVYRRLASTKGYWLIVAYIIMEGLWGAIAFLEHRVSLSALGYGLVSNTRYFIFFLDTLVITSCLPSLKPLWPKLAFLPAVVVMAFGLVQYFVLPYDFLKHFGYSTATIFPYEDINHNVHYIRIFSTLRGANPLGAYSIVILSLLLAWRQTRTFWKYLLVLSSLIVLWLTFSRGAWLGFLCAAAVLVWARFLHRRFTRIVPIVVAAIIVVSVITAALLRTNTTVQNIILHTQRNSAVQTTSDQGHVTALRLGLHDVLHEPFGRGPGTAGPASAYNTGHPLRIAENYYIQIAQETGWLGLLLFLTICSWIALLLWRQRVDSLSLGLLAGFVGVGVVNLLSHAWADDTLAYMWWGLAAITLAPAILEAKSEQIHDHKKTHAAKTKAEKADQLLA